MLQDWVCCPPLVSIPMCSCRCWDVRLEQGANQVCVIHSKHSMPFCSLALSPAGVTMAAGTAVEEEDAHIILW